jgi:hypothetical protein
MKILNVQITSPESDARIMFIIGVACVGFALIPPYEMMTAFFVFGAAVNFFNSWRVRWKILAARHFMHRSDS